MKTPTAFNWTAEMEAIWPREMRPTASGLLAIWEALHGAAVYDGAATYEAKELKNTITFTPDYDGWIEWHGGECPVDPDTVVEVRFGTPKPYRGEAGIWSWDAEIEASPADITHYRVVTPAEDDGWIAHKAGDPCPVPARLYVEIKTRRGDISREQAGEAYWGDCGSFSITHWRHLP